MCIINLFCAFFTIMNTTRFLMFVCGEIYIQRAFFCTFQALKFSLYASDRHSKKGVHGVEVFPHKSVTSTSATQPPLWSKGEKARWIHSTWGWGWNPRHNLDMKENFFTKQIKAIRKVESFQKRTEEDSELLTSYSASIDVIGVLTHRSVRHVKDPKKDVTTILRNVDNYEYLPADKM